MSPDSRSSPSIGRPLPRCGGAAASVSLAGATPARAQGRLSLPAAGCRRSASPSPRWSRRRLPDCTRQSPVPAQIPSACRATSASRQCHRRVLPRSRRRHGGCGLRALVSYGGGGAATDEPASHQLGLGHRLRSLLTAKRSLCIPNSILPSLNLGLAGLELTTGN